MFAITTLAPGGVSNLKDAIIPARKRSQFHA